jgi:hypothetical protein
MGIGPFVSGIAETGKERSGRMSQGFSATTLPFFQT